MTLRLSLERLGLRQKPVEQVAQHPLELRAKRKGPVGKLKPIEPDDFKQFQETFLNRGLSREEMIELKPLELKRFVPLEISPLFQQLSAEDIVPFSQKDKVINLAFDLLEKLEDWKDRRIQNIADSAKKIQKKVEFFDLGSVENTLTKKRALSFKDFVGRMSLRNLESSYYRHIKMWTAIFALTAAAGAAGIMGWLSHEGNFEELGEKIGLIAPDYQNSVYSAMETISHPERK